MATALSSTTCRTDINRSKRARLAANRTRVSIRSPFFLAAGKSHIVKPNPFYNLDCVCPDRITDTRTRCTREEFEKRYCSQSPYAARTEQVGRGR
jgi:hypothetical protein